MQDKPLLRRMVGAIGFLKAMRLAASLRMMNIFDLYTGNYYVKVLKINVHKKLIASQQQKQNENPHKTTLQMTTSHNPSPLPQCLPLPSYNNPILLSIKSSKKIINLTGTKYPIIKQVALEQLGYQLGTDFYTFLWTDYPLSIRQIRELEQTRRVNHLPEISELTRKNKLGRNLNTIRNVMPREFSFYPETYLLPMDLHKLTKKHHKGKFYIIKPENGSQGRGIYIINNPNKIDPTISGEIAQEYIENPLLIDGLKFDIRIYVLITSVSPLRIYLYKEGLARFATEEFQKPKDKNLNNAYSHLTNYSINKNNSCFLVDNDNFSTGHKRVFSSIFKEEEQYEKTLKQIADITIKTIISALPILENAYFQCKKLDPSSCFQLLGFDILLNQNLKPFLLQVNQNPSLATDTALDQTLKSALIKNILELVSGNLPCPTQQKQEFKIKNKDKYEQAHLGNFQRIYPCADLESTEKYDSIISKSHQLYKEKFGMNIVRCSLGKKKMQLPSDEDSSCVQWNLAPQHYSKDKLSKVYGARMTRTSQIRRRVVFY